MTAQRRTFGLDRHYEHDLRYEMADEWMQVANRLWAQLATRRGRCRSRKPASLPTTPRSHPIDFEGRFYKCRGPLNTRARTARTAGDLPGRWFAGRHRFRGQACRHRHRESTQVAAAKSFRQRMTDTWNRAAAHPRRLQGAVRHLASSWLKRWTEAQDKRARMTAALASSMETRLGGMWLPQHGRFFEIRSGRAAARDQHQCIAHLVRGISLRRRPQRRCGIC